MKQMMFVSAGIAAVCVACSVGPQGEVEVDDDVSIAAITLPSGVQQISGAQASNLRARGALLRTGAAGSSSQCGGKTGESYDVLIGVGPSMGRTKGAAYVKCEPGCMPDGHVGCIPKPACAPTSCGATVYVTPNVIPWI